jgi:replicative DNA helicase
MKNLRSLANKMSMLEQSMMGKVPPQALELEEAVLGALMLEKEALNEVIEILKPESFYKEGHQVIYKAIVSLFGRSEPVDLMTVVAELRKTGEMELSGGIPYITQLTTRVNSSANVVFHARIVAEQAIKRDLIRVSNEVLRMAFEDTTDVFELLDFTEKSLFDISESNIRKNYADMRSILSQAFMELETRRNHKDGLTGVPTGFMALDRITSGWQKSDLIILAARPAMGKCLGKGTKVLLYSGTTKNVEDIQVGDVLMGDDSTPRHVLSLGKGHDKMYMVRQRYGINYRVNGEHILYLQVYEDTRRHKKGEILTLTVDEFLQIPRSERNSYWGVRVGVEYPERKLKVSPYLFGYCLGILNQAKLTASPTDKPVNSSFQSTATAVQQSPALKEYADYLIKVYQEKVENSEEPAIANWTLTEDLYVPATYLVNSKANRLALLAGLIDACGDYEYLYSSDLDRYALLFADENLRNQIVTLANSLGCWAFAHTEDDRGKSTFGCVIRGDLSKMPIKNIGKKSTCLGTGLPNISPIRVDFDKEDDYYGFEIDGNHLFLLADGTVTHNTAFVLSALRNAAVMFKKGVAIFSLEMSSVQLVNRLISAEAELESEKIKSGKLADYEWEQVIHKTQTLSEAPIFIDDTPALTILELRAKCRRLKAQHDIQLIIIDYLQLMSGDGSKSGGNREQEIASISRALKQLAKELDVPVIALSQLSRAVEVRGGDKKPQLSDLRESGCVTGDTLILDAATGKLIPIKTLAERTQQTTLQCLSIDDDLRLGKQNMVKAFYSGKKQVFELKTRTGRTIKASANHPFFKLEGWTRLDNLKIGDKIAVARNLKAQQKTLQPYQIENYRVHWDEIISITPLGIEDVYDATVEVTHNFVANDFIIHNSIEQDADMVLFLYRPEYYGITQDENGNPTVGVGEVIIAKHRNGALDNVKLRFIGKYTKFSDLDATENFGGGDMGNYGSSFNQHSGLSDFDNNGGGNIILGSKMNQDSNDNGNIPPNPFGYAGNNNDEVPF